jgi:serine protease Do
MNRLRFTWVVVGVLAGAAALGAEPDALALLKERQDKIREVAAQVMPCVVTITSHNPVGTGSGVLVSKDGLILTASHVTDAITEGRDSKEVLVVFPDGREATGKVLGANRTCDSAMVRIVDPVMDTWPFVELGTSDEAKKGDWVVALGQPGGFEKDRSPPVRAGRIWGRDNFGAFFSDCTLVGGDSGGPLFDLSGKLLGIHSSIGGPLTVNRHVAIDNFRTDWDRLLKGDSWGELSLGESDPERPVIGALLDEESLNGVRVTEVLDGGPAALAGLRTDDIITHLDGEPVRNYLAYVRLISRHQPGDTVKLGLRRGPGDVLALELSLISRQSARRLSFPIDPPPTPAVYLGAEIEDARTRGARVTAVDPNSPAVDAGLVADDILVEVDGKPVDDALAFAKAVAASPPGTKLKLRVRRAEGPVDLIATLRAPHP